MLRWCFCVHIVHLSDSFYNTYGAFPEILKKRNRPYACLAIRIDGVTYAIPFRHHITHKHAFLTGDDKGLDYTKAIIIKDRSFIGLIGVQVDQTEFNALKGKEGRIAAGMRSFVNTYRKALRYPNNPHYSFIRNCSALQYFPEYFADIVPNSDTK